MSDRYKGKPLLRLLELYVLDAIGHLEEKDHGLLQQMTPKLCETFHVKGTWKQAIEKAMELPSNMPSLIADNWEKNLKIANDHKAKLVPQEFAMRFVDDNFK
jgi:hypothetical protein